MDQNHIHIGNAGEKAAVHYLKSAKYKILEKNYRIPQGEIDIISEKNGCIVFVEVKTLHVKDLDAKVIVKMEYEPEYKVNAAKLKKIARVAEMYLLKNDPEMIKDFQIDIVSVLVSKRTIFGYKSKILRHIKNIVL